MIKLFRIVGYLEGTSYVLLLFVAVPIKYYADDPQLVKLLGMPHGLLFVTYVIMSIINSRIFNWSDNKTFQILISSILPFGTYYIDKKYFRN
jgi:integral membrane protein